MAFGRSQKAPALGALGENRYLPEIDGLRAIAVISVILYHSKLSQFPNGYLGVDIFFVISGFVITRLIVNQGNNFTFREFYGRRIRRLAPSLILVLLVTEIVSAFTLYPSELRRVLSSILYINFFAGNVYFLQNSNYFSDSNFNPLLHTWSLGVEEQFYLLLPIALFLLMRKTKKQFWILLTVSAGAYASLVAAQFLKDTEQAFSFYMLPTRAWELLLGVGASLIVLDRRKNRKLFSNTSIDVFLALLGITMVVLSLFVISANKVFPDRASILVCVGMFLLLLSSRPFWLYRFLANRVLVQVGKRSYTAYLWHFPILGFFEYFLGRQLGYLELLYCYYFLIVVTELVYRFIETPIRKRKWTFGKSLKLLAGFTSIVVLSSSYLLLYPPRADTANAQRALLENFPSQIRIERIGSCYVDFGQSFKDFPVSCDPSEQSGSIVIMGDSHAATFAEGLRQTFKSVGEYTSSLCPPFLNAVRPDRPNCKAVNDSAFAHIQKVQPDSIILSANWWPYALFYSDSQISDYLATTIDFLNSISPRSKIYFFGGLPLWLPNLSDQILRSNIPFVSGGKVLNTNLARIRKNDALVKAVADRKGAHFISSIEQLCDATDQCIALIKTKEGKIEPYVYDAAHLTPTASLDLIQRFRATGQL